jgi:hypothetical protein
MYEYMGNRDEDNINYDIEHFNPAKVKNVCHYACSNMSYLNITVLVIIIILIYHFFVKEFLEKE